jgi:hypothetical protein
MDYFVYLTQDDILTSYNFGTNKDIKNGLVLFQIMTDKDVDLLMVNTHSKGHWYISDFWKNYLKREIH